MAKAVVSIIIPMRNVEKPISSIIKHVNKTTEDIQKEIILVDMNSTDNSLLNALKTVKEEKLCGFIVQCGSKTLPSALNAGIYKANGDFITFVFPRQLYMPFISKYCQTASDYESDLVFGKFPQTIAGKTINFSTGTLNGIELFKGVLNELLSFDIASIMVNRNFLIANHIVFDEECVYGYAEEFIYKILLHANVINQADIVMQRDNSFEIETGLPEEIGIDCFAKIKAMHNIYELLEYKYKNEKRLINKFRYNKMPETVLSCVNLLLKEGYSIKTIKAALKTKGYDEYLVCSQSTEKKLKRSIRLWNVFPNLYKP